MIVDARGYRCPIPTLRLRRALETADEVTLLADDPLAKVDVPHLCAQIGVICVLEAEGAALRFSVRRREMPAPGTTSAR